jgi:putative glutamine amidotransferase
MKTKPRPRIGISLAGAREGDRTYVKVQRNYVRSVVEAGAVPVLIPPLREHELAVLYADTLEGLLLTGGDDISPVVYDAEPLPELGVTDLTRDRWELALLRAAEEKTIPILGICRGLQIMNIARGGDLYQDIRKQTDSWIGHAQPEHPMEALHHRITIDDGSLMREIFGTTELRVNSFHHQAVHRIGTGLTITARAADGIVEAVEDRSRRFYLGVQFHAEALPPLDRFYMKIFNAFVSAAAVPGTGRR